MADLNPFDLLGDDDTEDPSQLIAAQQQKEKTAAPKKTVALAAPPAKQPAKLPTKPPPPSEAVREAKAEAGRSGGRGGRGYGRGRGGSGFNRDFSNNESSYGNREFSGGPVAAGDVDSGKTLERKGGYGGPRPFRGGRRGGFSNGDLGDGERPRRPYDRRSGTGRGNEMKREGSGQGNWGSQADEVTQPTEEAGNESEKIQNTDKPSGEEEVADGNKEAPAEETEEQKPEDKEMTLEEYEKVLEEKRKALQALKTEERKVDIKEFQSMQQLANKKNDGDFFIKLGSEKDKKKESAEKEERAKKSVSINEFLKPAEGERYYNPGGRGRGRGRGSRGGYSGGSPGSNLEAPSIEDPGQFPTLGAK